MRIPKPPWYKTLDKRLEGSEWLVNTILVLVILVSVVLIFNKDRVAKTAWVVYLISP